MAGEQLEDTNSSADLLSNLVLSDENKCQCCNKLIADLQKDKQDISSYKEIIQVLLEEQSSPHLQGSNETRKREESFYPIPRGSSMKPRTGINWSNFTQVIPIANKFELLANVNESNEVTCLTSASSGNYITSIKSKKNCQMKKTQRVLQKTQGNRNPGRRRRRILLLGDSHARNSEATPTPNAEDLPGVPTDQASKELDQATTKSATDDLSVNHTDLISKEKAPDQLGTEDTSHVKEADPDAEKEEHPVDLKTSTTDQNNLITSRQSSRNKKHPTSRGDDFLWELPKKM
jgi:hypothetical protein